MYWSWRLYSVGGGRETKLKNIQPQTLLFGDACLYIYLNMKIGMLHQKLKRMSQEVGALWKSLTMLLPSPHHDDGMGKSVKKLWTLSSMLPRTSMTFREATSVKETARHPINQTSNILSSNVVGSSSSILQSSLLMSNRQQYNMVGEWWTLILAQLCHHLRSW